MKCPKCGGEMEEGVIEGIIWYGGKLGKLSKWATSGFGLGKKVSAWRCFNCGKIELYSEGSK